MKSVVTLTVGLSTWAFVCLTILCCCSAGYMAEKEESSEYLAAIKKLLDINDEEYEVVFSEVHHSTEGFERYLDDLRRKGMFLPTPILDEPVFYRIRSTGRDFFVQSARSVSELEQLNYSLSGRYAYGIASNEDWQAAADVLTADSVGLEWKKNDRMTAADKAYTVAHAALSLGLPVRKGTVQWSGTSFTAVAADVGMVPTNLKGKRTIKGAVSFSNSLPANITYWTGTNRYSLILGYGGDVSALHKLPHRITRLEPLPTEVGDNIFTVEIFRLNLTNVPPAGTAVEEFVAANPKSTLIRKSKRDQPVLMQVNGLSLSNALPVQVGAQTSFSRRGLYVLGGILFLLSLVFLCIGRKGRSSPDK